MAAALLLPPLLLPLLLPLLRASLLGSELLLAATHAKVLCCVGAPYPEVYLSAQRYRYFVWDLASVQAAFWATDPGGLQRLLARSSSASSASGAVAASGDSHTSSRTRPGTKPAGNASCSATAARAPARSKERESLAAAAPATGDMLCCGCADASCHDNLSIGTPGWNKSGSGHSTNVTAVAAAGLCTAHPVAWHLHVHQPPVARGSGSSAWRSSAAVSSLLQQLWARLWQLRLRALAAAAAAGHAALHVFYIAAWNQPHARRVVSMSAVVSPRERLRRFPLGQVAWYCAGTAFDIGTHLLLAAALGRALLLPLPPGAPQHDQH